MVNLYCTLIINGRKTFNEVPEILKNAVKDRLLELGYSTDGKPVLKEG